MKTLYRAIDRKEETGAALPAPFPSLHGAGAAFRRKSVAMIAGEPGSFKSVFALNAVTFWARQGLGVLYFSADGDELTVLRREVSIMTGVEHASNYSALEGAAPALRDFDHLRFVYVTGTVKTMDEYNCAFEADYGRFPDVIVVDNAMDFTEGTVGAEEWMAIRQLLKDAVRFAAASNALVLVLHHCNEQKPSEAYPEGWPPPRREVQGKVNHKPALILTVGALGTRLGVAVVKNRHGIQDPYAHNPLWFQINPAMQVREEYRQEMFR